MHPAIQAHKSATSLAYMITVRLIALAVIALAALLLLLGPQLGTLLSGLATP